MTSASFWTSTDGRIESVTSRGERLALTLTFNPRNLEELAFIREHLPLLHFTERSTLARLGMEVLTSGAPRLQRGRVLLDAEAFIYDASFPTTPHFQSLLRPESPVGRLFFAPEKAKLSSDEIWAALRDNHIKLPDTLSIDRFGRVFLTPHPVRYTLSPGLTRLQLERLVNGGQDRAFLDKAQVREELDVLSIAPGTGILTSCSMFLKEHYIVLNRGEGNFGLHCGAVLLDPLKTFGTNIMLEIYNSSGQVVVNPVVSVEVFHAPVPGTGDREIGERRERLHATSGRIYKTLDARPPSPAPAAPRPRPRISLRGRSALPDNPCALLNLADRKHLDAVLRRPDLFRRNLSDAFDAAPQDADTLVLETFPNLAEHIELLARFSQRPLRRLVFRHPSRTHGFFFSTEGHARLDTCYNINLDVCWYNELMQDVHRHVYRKGRGFFIRGENVRRFLSSTILAIYGSAIPVDGTEGSRIQALIEKLMDFFGPNVGVLTGGGGGVMKVATDLAHARNCLTGACFLELEAQPPEAGVDFYNTFQETARHNRQKWFEAADFCIFNVGGIGTLEEVGIEMCNLKLGLRPRVPYVFYNATYWRELKSQVRNMIRQGRAPAWMAGYILFTDDPDEVVAFYRRTLRVL